MRGVLALLLIAGLSPALAQTTVYRCGPEGREYTDTPCKGGRAVEVADSRTDEERTAAREVAQRDAELADRLRQERLAGEEAAKGRGAAGLHTTPPPVSVFPPASTKEISRKMKKLQKKARKPAPRPSGDGTSATAPPSSRRAPG